MTDKLDAATIRELLARVEAPRHGYAVQLKPLFSKAEFCAIARYALELSDKWDAANQLVRAKAEDAQDKLGMVAGNIAYENGRLKMASELLQEIEQLESEQ
jgi:hypothetical protein